MFYLVETKYCAGIYLSRAAINFNLEKVKPIVREYAEYPEAEKKLKELEVDFPIPWQRFRLNCLYKIRDDKSYVVVYTNKRAGFVNVENLSDFLELYNIDISSSRTSRRLTYTQAVQLIWNIGVYTGYNICGAKTPVCWRYYRRKFNVNRERR